MFVSENAVQSDYICSCTVFYRNNYFDNSNQRKIFALSIL